MRFGCTYTVQVAVVDSSGKIAAEDRLNIGNVLGGQGSTATEHDFTLPIVV